MDTEPILGLSDELNSEFSSAMEEFVGLPDIVHDEEESSGHHSVELDASFEDKEVWRPTLVEILAVLWDLKKVLAGQDLAGMFSLLQEEKV